LNFAEEMARLSMKEGMDDINAILAELEKFANLREESRLRNKVDYVSRNK
jgi:hypothetical protein